MCRIATDRWESDRSQGERGRGEGREERENGPLECVGECEREREKGEREEEGGEGEGEGGRRMERCGEIR